MVSAVQDAPQINLEVLPTGPMAEPVVDTHSSTSSPAKVSAQNTNPADIGLTDRVNDENQQPTQTTVVSVKKQKRRVRNMSRVVCDKCQAEVSKKNLRTHQSSGRCRTRSLEMQMARRAVLMERSVYNQEESALTGKIDLVEEDSDVDETKEGSGGGGMDAETAAALEAITAQQFEPRPKRAKLDIPQVLENEVFKQLYQWLSNVASMAKSTSGDAIASLRKLMGFKYGADRSITLQELYYGLVDMENFLRFMTLLETSGMKAASRKRYTDSVRQGLLWLDTQPRTPENNVPTVEAIQAMRATVAVNKKGLARKARTQKHHLSYEALVATGQMLSEQELPQLLQQTAREFVDMVKRCNAGKLATPVDAIRAQKLLVTVMAVGTGVAVRGGDFGQLTVEHVKEAQLHGVMTVPNHKTSATSGPLVIPVPQWLQWMLIRWANLFRVQLVNQSDKKGATNKLFLSPRGRPIVNFAQVVLTPYIKERTGKHVTFTTIRKFFETVSFNSFDTATQKLISQGQCHSDATATAYYQLRQQQKAAHASHQAFDQRMGLSQAVNTTVPFQDADDQLSCGSLESLEMEVAQDSSDTEEGKEEGARSSSSSSAESAASSTTEVVDWDALPDPPEMPELPTFTVRVTPPSPPVVTDEKRQTMTPQQLQAHLAPQWTEEETSALVRAIAEWEKSSQGRGIVQWREIRALAHPHLQRRLPMNLKDKMRTLPAYWLIKLEQQRDLLQVPVELRRVYRRTAVKGRKGVHTLFAPEAKRARISEQSSPLFNPVATAIQQLHVL